VGGFNSYPAAGRAHGNAHVCLRQGRGIIHAVADHDDGVTACLVLLDDGDLIFRQQLGTIGNAPRTSQGFGAALVVAVKLDVLDSPAWTSRRAWGTSSRNVSRRRSVRPVIIRRNIQ
jgi:hypothetical protein